MMYATVGPQGQVLQIGSHAVEIDGARTVAVGGWVDAASQYIDETDAVVDMPPQPSAEHVFDWATHAWIDPRTLAQHQAARWEAMKVAREVAISAPLSTPYGTFDATPAARTNITDAVLMAQTLAAAGSPVAIDFTLADNSVVTLSAAQMVEVGLCLGARTQAAYATARALRAAIAAATSIEDVLAIEWA